MNFGSRRSLRVDAHGKDRPWQYDWKSPRWHMAVSADTMNSGGSGTNVEQKKRSSSKIRARASAVAGAVAALGVIPDEAPLDTLAPITKEASAESTSTCTFSCSSLVNYAELPNSIKQQLDDEDVYSFQAASTKKQSGENGSDQAYDNNDDSKTNDEDSAYHFDDDFGSPVRMRLPSTRKRDSHHILLKVSLLSSPASTDSGATQSQPHAKPSASSGKPDASPLNTSVRLEVFTIPTVSDPSSSSIAAAAAAASAATPPPYALSDADAAPTTTLTRIISKTLLWPRSVDPASDNAANHKHSKIYQKQNIFQRLFPWQAEKKITELGTNPNQADGENKPEHSRNRNRNRSRQNDSRGAKESREGIVGAALLRLPSQGDETKAQRDTGFDKIAAAPGEPSLMHGDLSPEQASAMEVLEFLSLGMATPTMVQAPKLPDDAAHLKDAIGASNDGNHETQSPTSKGDARTAAQQKPSPQSGGVNTKPGLASGEAATLPFHPISPKTTVTGTAAGTVPSMSAAVDAERKENSKPDSIVATPTNNNNNNAGKPDGSLSRMPLRCMCIGQDGQIYVYDPWHLLCADEPRPVDTSEKGDGKKRERNDDMGDAFAALLFGIDLDKQLKSTILPLSQPLKTISLAAVDRKSEAKMSDQPAAKKSMASSAASTSNMGQQRANDDSTSANANTSKRKPRANDKSLIASLMDWNPSLVEPSTLIYLTKHNKPTSMIQVGDYLVVIGCGFKQRPGEIVDQIRAKEIGKPKPHHRDGEPSRDQDGATGGDSNSKWWDDHGDGGTGPSSSPDADDLATAEDTKTELMESDDVPSQHMSNDRSDRSRNGGFVTFISLRLISETRTVYLPFRPTKISTLQADGHLCALVTGKDSSMAVAIPVKAFWLVLQQEVDAKSSNAASTAQQQIENDDTGSESDFQHQLQQEQENSGAFSLEDGDSPSVKEKKAKRSLQTAMVYIKRFQLLPCDVPLTGVEGTILGVSSSAQANPPSMVLAYSDTTSPSDLSSTKDVLIMQRQIGNIAPIARVSTGKFANYKSRMQTVLVNVSHSSSTSNAKSKHASNGQSTKTASPALGSTSRASFTMPVTDGQLIGVGTGHQHGHIARLVLSSEETVDELWSHEGQGWCLVGTKHRTFFILWEGSNPSRGAQVVKELDPSITAVNGQSVSQIDPLPAPLQGTATTTTTAKLEPDGMTYRKSKRVSEESLVGLPYIPDAGGRDSMSTARDSMAYSEPSDAAAHFYAQANKSIGYERYDVDRVTHNGNGDLVNDIVFDALESISGLSVRGDSYRSLPPRMVAAPNLPSSQRRLSHSEKSTRLLYRCTSWTDLDGSFENQLHLMGQVPIVCLTAQSRGSDQCYVLTLRQLLVDNGESSPFQQVLSWLCGQRDYFTAASIALDLLNDADTLYSLWQSAERIDEENERDKLQGLLDGISAIPSFSETAPASEQQQDQQPQPQPQQQQMVPHHDEDGALSSVSDAARIQVQLADMTVACLAKGGYPMSDSLMRFLKHNKLYDASKASLILVSRTAGVVSGDVTAIREIMQVDPDRCDEGFIKNYKMLLWPVRCMLEVGASRDCFHTTMMLLNGTIPDELRNRPTTKSFLPPSFPSSAQKAPTPHSNAMQLAKELVKLIVSSSTDGAEELLNLLDEGSRIRFWQSLNRETQLELALIEVDGKHPMLRQWEVREWCRAELHAMLKDYHVAASSASSEAMPTTWLQLLCQATLRNAGCDLEDMTAGSGQRQHVADTDAVTDAAGAGAEGSSDGDSGRKEGIDAMQATDKLQDPTLIDTDSPASTPAADEALSKGVSEDQEIRTALIAMRGSGGVDFDLAIPCLLLLSVRQSNWWNESRKGGDMPASVAAAAAVAAVGSSNSSKNSNSDNNNATTRASVVVDDSETSKEYIATQRLLEGLCDLAGRYQMEPPMFDFDEVAAMRQCALASNVRAGSFLVGGRNGFVLLCCDILMKNNGMDMESAESFLLHDQLQLDVLDRWTSTGISSSQSRVETEPGSSSPSRSISNSSHHRRISNANGMEVNGHNSTEDFVLEPYHLELLKLLNQHVLSIRTFGQFEAIHLRGRVDPVFAATCIFRCWLLLTASKKTKRPATTWLVGWLRSRLEISDEDMESKRRLVSAALVRALVWASPSTKERPGFAAPEDPAYLLAYAMGMESKFVSELAISCNGLVESIPYPIAKDMMMA